MGNIRTLRYHIKPSAEKAFEAVEAHERAGDYTEAEAIRERIRTGVDRETISSNRYVTHTKKETV